MLLHSYKNGNTTVSLYQDGTKERSFEGVVYVEHPESIDVKITDYCDAGCSFCHEQSTRAGAQGDLNKLSQVLSCLPAGVEIAIGGGNPLSHPDLIPFLERCQRQGLVPNITVNQKHLIPFRELILDLISRKLVYGVGISYSSDLYLTAAAPILQATDNVVFHLIMGINRVSDVSDLYEFCKSLNKSCKILLLGYKQFGFGLNYYLKNKRIESNKYSWYTQLINWFGFKNLVLSFDNLAISQLNLKRYFSESAWSKFFMGNDFVFTMYIDGVKQEYAPSSTSDSITRVSFNKGSLLDYFKRKLK